MIPGDSVLFQGLSGAFFAGVLLSISEHEATVKDCYGITVTIPRANIVGKA